VLLEAGVSATTALDPFNESSRRGVERLGRSDTSSKISDELAGGALKGRHYSREAQEARGIPWDVVETVETVPRGNRPVDETAGFHLCGMLDDMVTCAVAELPWSTLHLWLHRFDHGDSRSTH